MRSFFLCFLFQFAFSLSSRIIFKSPFCFVFVSLFNHFVAVCTSRCYWRFGSTCRGCCSICCILRLSFIKLTLTTWWLQLFHRRECLRCAHHCAFSHLHFAFFLLFFFAMRSHIDSIQFTLGSGVLPKSQCYTPLWITCKMAEAEPRHSHAAPSDGSVSKLSFINATYSITIIIINDSLNERSSRARARNPARLYIAIYYLMHFEITISDCEWTLQRLHHAFGVN